MIEQDSAQFENYNFGTTALQAKPEFRAILADDIEELSFARGTAAAVALGVLALRETGELEQVPVVDAIGTGRLYYETVERFGQESLEAKKAFELVVEDCRTMLFEGLYAWGFVSKTKKVYNPEDGHFYVGNRAARPLFGNGLSSLLPDWEQTRRSAEYVEEATHEAQVAEGLHKDNSLLTISMHPDKNGASTLGYRDENMKMMVRYTDYIEDNGEIKRVDYQASCDGTALATIKGFFAKLGIDSRLAEDEQGILRLQTLLPKIGIGRVLQILDETQGDDSFMLRPSENPNASRYENIVQLSAEREAEAIDHVASLTKYALSLSRQNTSPIQARALLKDKLSQTVHEICRNDPSKALYAFDNKTYQRYAAAEGARLSGNYQLAEELERQAIQEAPPVGACGSGGASSELAHHIGGIAREALPHENGKFGGVVYEGGQCLHCSTSPTIVGEWGYCEPCADQVCGEENEPTEQKSDGSQLYNEIEEIIYKTIGLEDTKIEGKEFALAI